tara:strand:- start:91 stop:288 length:198 start_codon:yes stop_codon:yes gene_type:complete
MALSQKQKRQIGDIIVNDIHKIMEFYSEELENKIHLQELSIDDEADVNNFLISIISRIPNNIYKK